MSLRVRDDGVILAGIGIALMHGLAQKYAVGENAVDITFVHGFATLYGCAFAGDCCPEKLMKPCITEELFFSRVSDSKCRISVTQLPVACFLFTGRQN